MYGFISILHTLAQAHRMNFDVYDYWLVSNCHLFNLGLLLNWSHKFSTIPIFSSMGFILNLIFIFLVYFSGLWHFSPNVGTQVIMQKTNCLIEFRWLSKMLHTPKHYCIIFQGVCENIWEWISLEKIITHWANLDLTTAAGIIPKGKRESFVLKNIPSMHFNSRWCQLFSRTVRVILNESWRVIHTE